MDYGFDRRPLESYTQHRNWEVQREADLLLCTLLLHGLSAKACDLEVLCLIVALGKIWSHFHGVDDKNNCYRVSWIRHSGHGLEVNMVVVPG